MTIIHRRHRCTPKKSERKKDVTCRLRIINVVGARPNFMKIAPILEALDRHNKKNPGKTIEQTLVHTGQHYDAALSELFFEQLGLPRPDIDLGVGSASHAVQTAEIMKRFEPVVVEKRPDLVLVVGDVNSTIACALTAVKLGTGVVHVEAGLRSFDRTMPEEINRVLTDQISDLLFVTEKDAIENLRREGISGDRIFFVGNVMIDSLLKNVEKSKDSDVLLRTGLMSGKKRSTQPYGVITLHRPSNVDDKEKLSSLLSVLEEASRSAALIFPVHPRTKSRIEEFGLGSFFKEPPVDGPGLYIMPPLGYLDFLHLMANASLVLTDSGGIQEETTILGVPCITLRENTERPVTLTEGTNRLVGTDGDLILEAVKDALEGRFPEGKVPELWDGKAAERIVDVLAGWIGAD